MLVKSEKLSTNFLIENDFTTTLVSNIPSLSSSGESDSNGKVEDPGEKQTYRFWDSDHKVEL